MKLERYNDCYDDNNDITESEEIAPAFILSEHDVNDIYKEPSGVRRHLGFN